MCIIEKRGSHSLILSGNDCSPWSKLSDDLVVEILCRLPAENLIRSKCVCKFWDRLITDVCVPKFSTSPPLRGFFYQGENTNDGRYRYYLKYAACDDRRDERVVESLSALLPFKFTFKDLINSCSGLLLFATGSIPQYYVCNPLTKQCVEIPRNIAREKAAIDANKVLTNFAALAFNPRQSSHYKVVSFNYWTTYSVNKTVNIDVFSSDTGGWLSHTMPIEAPVLGLPWIRRTVYLYGVLYRLSCSKYLLHFDLNELNAHATELPMKDKTDSSGFIGVSRDCLHYSNHEGSTLFVWFLENHSKECRWVLKHSICINDLCKYKLGDLLINCPPKTFNKPWAFDPNSEAIFFGFAKAILRYQVDNGAMEVIHSMDLGKEIYANHYAFVTYSPCVVILKDFPNVFQGN